MKVRIVVRLEVKVGVPQPAGAVIEEVLNSRISLQPHLLPQPVVIDPGDHRALGIYGSFLFNY